MKSIISSGKILSFYEDAIKIKNGEIPFPRMALIYPTYKCNYNCSYCLYKNMDEVSSYPYKKLVDIIDQLKDCGVKAVEFCGGGEPTVYEHFEKIVRHINSVGMQFGILTNGSTLDVFGDLLLNNSRYIRISIHDNYNTFDKIKRLTAKRKNNDCAVGLKLLATKNNIFDIETKIKKAVNCGADYIQIKGVRSSKCELSEIEKSFVNKLILKYSPFAIGNTSTSELKTKCVMSPIHTMIDSNGDVFVCCYYQYRMDSHKIGNVIENKFRDIWGTENHKNVIKNIKIPECNKYDCRFHNYNKIMEDVITNDKYHINFI